MRTHVAGEINMRVARLGMLVVAVVGCTVGGDPVDGSPNPVEPRPVRSLHDWNGGSPLQVSITNPHTSRVGNVTWHVTGVTGGTTTSYYYHWYVRPCYTWYCSWDDEMMLVGEGLNMSSITLPVTGDMTFLHIQVQAREDRPAPYLTGSSAMRMTRLPAWSWESQEFGVSCLGGNHFPYQTADGTNRTYRRNYCTGEKQFD